MTIPGSWLSGVTLPKPCAGREDRSLLALAGPQATLRQVGMDAAAFAPGR